MADELVLRQDDTPTIFNKHMAIGALLGNIAGGILGGMAGGAYGSYAGRLLGSAIVGLIAGVKHKTEMEHDLNEGKIVSKPTSWNKDTLLGGLIGWMIGGALIGFAAAALVSSGVTITAAVATSAVAASLITLVAGTAFGAIIGGKHGKHVMAKEYEEAQRQLAEQQAAARAPQLEQEQSREPTRSFAKQIEHERQQATAGQKSR